MHRRQYLTHKTPTLSAKQRRRIEANKRAQEAAARSTYAPPSRIRRGLRKLGSMVNKLRAA
jgi:hypothetical protein